MIKVKLDNEILDLILKIEKVKFALEKVDIPPKLSNAFRKNTRKRTTYASNHIEGNPLSYEQAEAAIESKSRYFLKPEQEIRDYYLALEMLEKKAKENAPVSLDLLLSAQKQICEGESKEKIGLRGAMPPGVLFAVWNEDRTPAYIPPQADEVPGLLQELFDYLERSDDHPLIKAAIIHYQIVTIHPFEDGNGRTARIVSGYYLSLLGYGFKSIGSLEEYIAYDIDEYYRSLQMGLPAMYYDGRNDPPHPEVWIKYYLRIFSLYSSKALSIALGETKKLEDSRTSHLSRKARDFLDFLHKKRISEFAPIDLAKKIGVTNKTIINWSAELASNGYLKPIIVKKRIRRYEIL